MKRVGNLFINNRGSATVLVAITVSVIIGFAAMVTDAGLIYLNRTHLSNTLDCAVLAAVQELPADPASALNIAVQYAEANDKSTAEYVFSIGDDNTSISGTARKTVSMFLARVLGNESKDVQAQAKARITSITGVSGVVPWGVSEGDYNFGERVCLKLGGGDGDYGCFGALELDGSGASEYEENIKYGYDGTIRVGDVISVEPGNMSGPTVDGVEYRVNSCHHTPQCSIISYVEGCPRICVLPLGVYDDGVGSNKNFIVNGFGAFLIDEYVGSGCDCDVYGWFIEYTVPGETGDGGTDHGVYTAELCG